MLKTKFLSDDVCRLRRFTLNVSLRGPDIVRSSLSSRLFATVIRAPKYYAPFGEGPLNCPLNSNDVKFPSRRGGNCGLACPRGSIRLAPTGRLDNAVYSGQSSSPVGESAPVDGWVAACSRQTGVRSRTVRGSVESAE